MKSPRRAGVLRNRENRKNEIKRRSEKSAGAVFVKKGSVIAALRFAPAAGGGRGVCLIGYHLRLKSNF